MNNNNGSFDTKPEKKWKLAVVFLVVFFAVLGAIVIGSGVLKRNFSRTIMIYMVGADLESRSGLATVDLNSIDYNAIKSKDISVYLLAGGASDWKNDYISKNETSIYKLTEQGFAKVKSQSLKNMGEASVLSSFLNYVKGTTKADRYDLIFWNHGAGIFGSEFDEISNDNLSLDEIKKALSNTDFKKSNKLDSVIFRTCLNGTIEVADVLKEHARYMVASEEITLGYKTEGVLDFINTLETTDDGPNVGVKFVNRYIDFIKELKSNSIGSSNEIYSTYSVVDLSKINKLEKNIEKFFSSVDLESNFKNISKIRSDLPQYAFSFATSSSTVYDSVDLYNLMVSLRNISSKKADKVLSILEETVIYNYANNNKSRGLSIYFPYNASITQRAEALEIYNGFNGLGSYLEFINSFNSYRSSKFNAAIKEKYDGNIEDKENDYTDVAINLTDKQRENYSSSTFYVLKENKDGTYSLVQKSENVVLNENKIKGTIRYKELSAVSIDGKIKTLVGLTEKDNSTDTTIKMYDISAILKGNNSDEVSISLSHDISDNNLKMGKAVLISKNKYTPGNIIVDVKDYDSISFTNEMYKVIDEKNNLNDNWEFTSTKLEDSYKVQDFKLKMNDFDKDASYYCIFKVTDVFNNIGYSKLIKIK